MVIVYNKLVRDKIPDIIEELGGRTEWITIEDTHDYREALRLKLLEEIEEFSNSNISNLEEMSDVCEVLKAIAKINGWTFKNIDNAMKNKVKENGSFNDKKFLVFVDKKMEYEDDYEV